MSHFFSLPYGKLPSRGLFNRAMSEKTSPNRLLRFKNDPRLGNVELTSSQFFNELLKAKVEGSVESMAWVQRHLFFISILWEQADVSETSAA
jgi:hypothetical protein